MEVAFSKSADTTIGFLNQDLLSYQTDDSILSVAMQAFAEAVQIQQEIDKMLHQMEAAYEDKLVDQPHPPAGEIRDPGRLQHAGPGRSRAGRHWL